MQDNLVKVFSKIYNINLVEVKKFETLNENNIFILETTLEKNEEEKKFDLNAVKIFSTSPEKIQSALSNKEIVPENKIIENIRSRYR